MAGQLRSRWAFRVLCLALPVLCGANQGGSFRGGSVRGAVDRTVTTEEVEASLRESLEALLQGGSGAAAQRLAMTTPVVPYYDVDQLDGRYTWIMVTGSLGAFAYGWGTGSNDVANAFGTSVGAKTLTLKQAVIMAALFNFTGALVLGRTSAETIAGGIAKSNTFQTNAPAYAYGMSIVLWLGFLWQGFASYMSWNVSATHAIIGGIVGFAMVWGGVDSVFWAEPDSKKIPPFKGVVPIIISWFFSPLFTGAAAATFYGLTRYFVLLSPNSTTRSFQVLPIMIFFVVTIDLYFIFTKGAKKQLASEDNWSDEKALWISAVVGVGCAVFAAAAGIPFLKHMLKKKKEERAAELANSAEKGAVGESAPTQLPSKIDPISSPVDLAFQAGTSNANPTATSVNGAQVQTHSFVGSAFGALAEEEDVSKANVSAAPATPTWKERMMKGVEYDMHAVAEDDPLVAAIHANAEKWDEDTEFVFGYLQVISAICVIFAHGAGEVGYMAGPLAVIFEIVKSPGKNVVASGGTVTPEIWQILIGAFGLLVGLATYGYKVCAAVGTQMAKITPSRGYAAELATSFVIMIAAQFSLPTSSSQCITGGILGIALFEGAKGINFRLVGLTAMSWVWTLLVMGLGTALIFSQGIYAPNKFVTIAYNDKMRSYQTLCSEHNYCRKGEYLDGCTLDLTDGRPVYTQGKCTNCSIYASKKCSPWQYLSGCTTAKSGSCTNCTSSNKAWTTEKPFIKCAVGEYLTGCPGTCTK